MKVYFSDQHTLHNPPFEVYNGGERTPYAEVPQRTDRILDRLRQEPWLKVLPFIPFGKEAILEVHDAAYIHFLETAFDEWLQEKGGEKVALLPATFPGPRQHRSPGSVLGRAGLYIHDLAAPIVAGTFSAAVGAANCALSGAQDLLSGERAVLAACRPPGHHAGRANCAGYCYLNNAAIAAQKLSKEGRVAILDIDYHAGNGTQEIFFRRADVFTVSIHADPAYEYPYYSGYADEIGSGPGAGFHRNFPLPLGTGDEEYLHTLDAALVAIREFDPDYLLVSAGMDIYTGDPLGKFSISSDCIHEIGVRISNLSRPAGIVLEGGYDLESLGQNILALLEPFNQVAA